MNIVVKKTYSVDIDDNEIDLTFIYKASLNLGASTITTISALLSIDDKEYKIPEDTFALTEKEFLDYMNDGTRIIGGFHNVRWNPFFNFVENSYANFRGYISKQVFEDRS